MAEITPTGFAHGKDTIVELDDDDITALVNTTSVDRTVEDGDTTTFADEARRFIPGLDDNGDIPLEGPFSPELYTKLVALRGVAGTSLRIVAGGGEAGMPYVEASGFVNQLNSSFSVGDPSGITGGFKVDGALTDGVISS